MTMSMPAAPAAVPNPIARFTGAVFGLVPISLTMLVIRITLALPFWKSGLTKWDDWFTLSFGAQILFTDEFKLHIFGAEYAYPAPLLMAYASAICEVTFPVLIDPENRAADAFGISWKQQDYLIEVHKTVLETDLSKINGDESWTLPMPGRFAIGQDGVVHYAEVNPDYTQRPEPEDLLPALRAAVARAA